MLDDKMFTLEEVAANVPEYAGIYAAAETQFPGAPERIRFNEALRRLIDLLVTGLIEGTRQAVEAAGVASVDAVREHPRRLAVLASPASATNAALKRFLHRFVYSSPLLAEERTRSAAMIAELFGYFLAHPESLPETYREESGNQPLHRVVCDYIAGMTDGFFRRTYEQAFR